MTGFSSPNYTQTPNDLFDSLMAEMGDAELRVVLAAVRLTLGFHKRYDAISLTTFQRLTGLSRQGVIDGISLAIANGLIQEVGQGKRGVKLYELVINVDQSTSLTSQGSDQSSNLTGTGQASRHTKESIQKKESKEIKDSVSGETASEDNPPVLTVIEEKATSETSQDKDPIPGSAEPLSRKAYLDEMFEAIATVWNTRAGGWIGNMRAMMLGEAKKGDWKAANFNPPATPSEVLDFGKYMIARRQRDRIVRPVTTPSTIQRWFYDYRASLHRAVGVPAAIKADPTPGAKPLQLTHEQSVERAQQIFRKEKI